jgi:hypothetical protein
MTDTNKERERMIRDLQGVALTVGNIATVLTDKGYRFLGDRVGQTFEEWKKLWNRGVFMRQALENNSPVIRELYDAATLQPQQTMGRKMLTEAFDAGISFQEAEYRISQQSGFRRDDERPDRYNDALEVLLGKLPTLSPTFAKPKPLEFVPDAHPVEGELTRPISGPLSEPLTKDWFDRLWKSEGAEGPVSRDNCWKAIESHVAATEARVRGENQEKLDLQWQAACAVRDENESLRATIADLTAKMETAVQIPKEWMVESVNGGQVEGIVVYYTAQSKGYWVDQGHANLIAYIPRPTPKTLTNEEKLTVVVEHRYPKTRDILGEWRRVALEQANGKSIDELYAEVKGGEK